MSNGIGKKSARPNGHGGGNGAAPPAANGLALVPSISTGAAGIDLSSVEKLAGQGLSRDQILAELGIERELPPALQLRVDAAMKKGRALGAARIKQAQYEAALAGSVSAQSHMLELLEDADDDGEVTVTVERVVIGGESSSEETQT